MRVFHIITGLNNGGAEAVLYRLCTNDTKVNHTVISMMGSGKYGPLLEAAGITVYCLNMPQGKLTLGGLKQLHSLLKSNKPDVVQTWMYHADLVGGVIAKITGTRKIFWNIHHTTLEPSKSKRSTILIAKLCAHLSKWVPTQIICCADKALQVHAGAGYTKKKMVVIHNGYSLDQFKPSAKIKANTRELLEIPRHTFAIGLVGRFNPLKDHNNFLISLSLLKKKYSSFTCVLVGADINSANSELTQSIHKLGLHKNIKLLDQRSDIPAIMNALDLHVLSSTSEAFPNVIAEAMACGTPCVTTDVGDAAFIVEETGWVVPASNPQLLCDAIAKAMEEKQTNVESWHRRQSAARKRIVNNFSIEAMIGKYHKVWGVKK